MPRILHLVKCHVPALLFQAHQTGNLTAVFLCRAHGVVVRFAEFQVFLREKDFGGEVLFEYVDHLPSYGSKLLIFCS